MVKGFVYFHGEQGGLSVLKKKIWKESLIVTYCSMRFPWLWITYVMCSNPFVFRLKISLSVHVDKSSSATLAVQLPYSMFLMSPGRHFNEVLLKTRYIYMQGFSLKAEQQANWLAVRIGRGGGLSAEELINRSLQ